MDPITIASKRFQRQFNAFWNPPPGAVVAGPPVLRLVFERSERKEVLQTLRLLEWAPTNRRPFILLEGDVDTLERSVHGATVQLEGDYEKLTNGLAADGVSIAPLTPLDRPVTLPALVAAIRTASQQIASALDGLVVVWIPSRVSDQALNSTIVNALAGISDGRTLRLAIGDAPGTERSFPSFASFEVDEDALLKHLKNLGREKSSGPAAKSKALTPTEKASLERELGRAFPSEATGMDLRAYLLDAAAALRTGGFKIAAKKFRAARMLCHVSGLLDEEAMVSIALGSAAYGAGDRAAAFHAYRRGKEIALARGNKLLAAQAELGVAVVHLASTDYSRARESYGEVITLTSDVPALRIDALRMMGECFVLEGAPSAAVRVWNEALDAVEALPFELRAATPYLAVGRALIVLLRNTRQGETALGAERRLVALAEPPLGAKARKSLAATEGAGA